ncbi:MAG: aminodeoxychorismate synthase component I [Actinomycetota bacterium]
MYGARFDDAETGQSFELKGALRELVAEEVGDVRSVLRSVSEEAASGNWVAGYVAYEAAPAFDDALVVQSGLEGPLAWFGVFSERQEIEPPSLESSAPGSFSVSRWNPEWDAEQYAKAFGEVRRHIEVGESYQVNLTFHLRAAVSGPADLIYADLLLAQKPSYAAHLWHGDTHVLSVSPEQFFSVRDGRLATRPMKGTARRGRWAEEDAAIRDALSESSKDRAENLMIVDLLRNDLGRVAEFGSVNVDELLTLEKYGTVWQMTSQISADLRQEVELVDVFGALFPCGSVTGAPKGSSMKIISDLELAPRGVYCGAIGFVPPGDGINGSSFNVAIRTVEIDESEGVALYGVGGGITWASEADDEYAEAMTKARVLSERPMPLELIETIRWDDGWLLLDEHLARLSKSATYWDMPCEVDSLRPMLAEIETELSGPTRLRIVAYGEGKVSFSFDTAPERFALGPGPAEEPVRLRIDVDPLDPRNPRLFHKTTDRHHFDVRRKRHADVDDVLCVNNRGLVTESTISNVAFLINGAWFTPPMTDGLLPGVLRGKLIDDGVLTERSIPVADALAAEAVALLNSVRGWEPAVLEPIPEMSVP